MIVSLILDFGSSTPAGRANGGVSASLPQIRQVRFCKWLADPSQLHEPLHFEGAASAIEVS
jgi:hypothetical protein